MRRRPIRQKDVASHFKAVYCVDFRPDGKMLASCGEDDGTVLLWDVGADKTRRASRPALLVVM